MAGTPGPVGGIVAAQSWNLHAPPPPGGGSWTQATAWAAWNAQTGTHAQVQKVYSDTAADIPTDIDLGIQVIVCYDSTTATQASLDSFTASVKNLAKLGLTGPGKPGYVVLHQEVELHLTAAQFLAIMQFDPAGTGVGGYHAAANAAGFQLYWDAAGSANSKWAGYFPGAQYLDGIAADFYADGWISKGKSPTYLKVLTDFADAHNLPFGLFEIGFTGASPTIPAQSDFQDYMAYITQLMGNRPAQTVPNVGPMPAGRLARGLTNGPVLWYDGANNTNLNQIVPMPGNVPYDTYAVQTAYPNLYNALVATGPVPPSINTTSLPAGVVGTAYSAALRASGGTTPYTWSKTGTLPPGLSLSAAGVISGTPTTGGTYSFTVTVTDATSLSSSATLSITVNTVAPALSITTTSVPAGVVSTAYSTTLAASGGTPPYTWSETGPLPPGLSLSSAGVISGTPTTAGTYPFTATVTDNVTATASVSLSIAITAVSSSLAVGTTALPAGVVGTPYGPTRVGVQLGAIGGSPPYTWSETGPLPPGLVLTSGGLLSGTPTTAGTYTPTWKVTDSALATASATLNITVTGTAPQVVVPTPAVPGQGQPGSFTPGLQGTAQPLNPLFTPAIPGRATPGAFMPGDPGALSLAPPVNLFTPAVPGQAQPGLFTPGDPGAPLLFPVPQGPFVVQQMAVTAVANYGWVTAEFSGNAAGNMLVVVCGWDVNATAPAAPMPAVWVVDSAQNYWVHVGTTTAANTGSRCTVWVAPNAQPVTWVSLSPTGFVSSLAAVILEVGNAPKLCSVDLQAVTSNTAATVLAASPGSARSADLGFTVLTAGSTTAALLTAPAGWVPLGEVQAGVGQPNGTSLWPYWQPSVPAGSNQPVTYQVSTSVPLSAVTVLIKAVPSPPVQTDPNFPVLKVEAAFGFTPGDPTQSPPTWTDITNRCASKDGTPFIEPMAGKGYELGQPETGELLISCRNNDGQLTPGNVNSVFAPGTGVQLGTPVRVSAYWAGSWNNVAFGYVERWPMDWPDMRQWGMSAMKATDAFSALSAATSYSALSGDMLLDAPYVLIPCNEQYTTQANSLVPQISFSEARGLPAANISRVNQRSGYYVDGSGAQCATGQSTTLLGSQDTGFGCSQFTAPVTATSSGPGMVYWDPNLPSPLAPSGLSVEFWLTITAPAVAANQQPVVFTAFGVASNYQTANPSLQLQVQNFTGNNLLQVTFANGTKMTAPFTPSPNPQQVVIVFGTGTVTLYVNGALAASQALTAGQATAWQACMLGCGNYAYHVGSLTGGVFTAMSLGIYPYQLPLQRIASHYVTGVSGQAGVDGTTRIAQLLAWNNLGVPRGGRVTFNGVTPGVLQGPAYSLSGANVSAAVNQVATNEQGLVFAGPDGTLQFVHRWGLFNQAPQAVFGDNPVLGEVPFQPGQAFDFDNSKLGNIAKVQRTTGPTTGVTATVTSPASQAAYFARSLPQTGIQTTSDLDAFDIANLLNSAYSQPQIRLRQLTVDAASYPAAFSTVLGLQQGNAAIVNRRPVGGVPISANVIVQKVSHRIGPKMWETSYEMSPYPPLNAVLQLDAPGFDVIGQNALP